MQAFVGLHQQTDIAYVLKIAVPIDCKHVIINDYSQRTENIRAQGCNMDCFQPRHCRYRSTKEGNTQRNISWNKQSGDILQTSCASVWSEVTFCCIHALQWLQQPYSLENNYCFYCTTIILPHLKLTGHFDNITLFILYIFFTAKSTTKRKKKENQRKH